MLADKSVSTFVVHKAGILHWVGKWDGYADGALELLSVLGCTRPISIIEATFIYFIYWGLVRGLVGLDFCS